MESVRDEGPVVSGTRRGRGGGLVRWVLSIGPGMEHV
jgi:hypothetical protein